VLFDLLVQRLVPRLVGQIQVGAQVGHGRGERRPAGEERLDPLPLPKDALRPLRGVPETVPGDLRLQAIAERDGHPVALINDRLVREGDSFDGVTVLRIGVAEVEIEVRGQRRVLRF
jgi:hypothetical protein